MKLPQLLHSTRSYGRANSAFSWKLLVLERGFLSYRLKLPSDRSEKDAWSGFSPAGALRKLPFILYSRPAEDWLRRSGSSSTISPITLFFAISARGRHNYSRSSTRRGSRIGCLGRPVASSRVNQGRQAAARDLLAPVYGWFAEEFDTAALKAAKALLDDRKSTRLN